VSGRMLAVELNGFIDPTCDLHQSKCRGVECGGCGVVVARHLNLTEAVTVKRIAARVHVCPPV
jgi:hypothetical protein